MSKNYTSEREGQLRFFDKFAITDTELANYTDGIYKGTIFEFKKSIPNTNTVLFQAIKYLSHMRIKGVSIPANILLVALNEEIAYLFHSADYVKEIETPYAGAASKNNSDFAALTNPEIIRYDSPTGIHRVTEILADESFTRINIDVFDVVGWAERFYREIPNASKIKLFEELRSPKHFREFIYPWTGDEKDFKYIMDLLNDRQHKKELGAFYTPAPYCLQATELVRKAIAQIPKGHDYIILDRCAGTGNLEEFLTDKVVDDITIPELDKYISKSFKRDYLASVNDGIDLVLARGKVMAEITLDDLEKYETSIKIREYLFDDELSHTIVNTYELKEWIVLNERIGDRVKLIIPPQEEVSPTEPLVTGGDALDARFIVGQMQLGMSDEYKNSIDLLLDYVQNERTNIILLENPPYRDQVADNGKVNRSFVLEEMTKILSKLPNSNISTARDLSNQFIWSAWTYYMRKDNDCFILFSPVKYWKSLGLSNKKFMDGFLFNRHFFHAGPSAISCILWQNVDESRESISLKAFDINLSDNDLVTLNKIKIEKVHKTFEPYFDRRAFEDDKLTQIYSETDGTQTTGRKVDGKSIENKNVVGYLRTDSFGVDPKHVSLTRQILFNARGFYLREDNFIDKLPLFAAKLYPQKNWYERDIYFTTADGGDRYLADKDFLKSCFIFTCLSQRNHCRSFYGSDGRFYRNELCFDEGTVASQKLVDYELTEAEKKLLSTFKEILRLAKETKNYNPRYTLGTYQVDQELNTFWLDEVDGTKHYDYVPLNTALIELKSELAKYYEATIQPKLFEYELLK